jgi:hypothetical protein
MTPQSHLNALGREIAAMMREYNALKVKLIEMIDKHGVDVGDELIVTPDEYDHLFDEGYSMIKKIDGKLDEAICFCGKEGMDLPVVLLLAKNGIAEHKDFFENGTIGASKAD